VGLRDKLKRLEAEAEAETTTLVCPECGAEFTAYGDVAVEFIAHEWVSEGGAETYRETPEDIQRLFDHEHDSSGFLQKSSGLPFLSKAVSGIDFGGEAEIA
jgi:hypothetical protein